MRDPKGASGEHVLVLLPDPMGANGEHVLALLLHEGPNGRQWGTHEPLFFRSNGKRLNRHPLELIIYFPGPGFRPLGPLRPRLPAVIFFRSFNFFPFGPG